MKGARALVLDAQEDTKNIKRDIRQKSVVTVIVNLFEIHSPLNLNHSVHVILKNNVHG